MNKFIAHILVVDDDDGIRSLIKKYLTENNFLITTANCAEDASQKISIVKFDLIILDINKYFFNCFFFLYMIKYVLDIHYNY